MAFLSEFEFDIKHIKGKEKNIVDALYDLMEVSVRSISTDFV